MKYLLFLFLSVSHLVLIAQSPRFVVHNFSLPEEIKFYNNQFSGLYVNEGKLFIMSESRLQENAEAKLFTIKLEDLDHQRDDTTYMLPYNKLPIYNLEMLKNRIDFEDQKYEGLEAMVIDGNDIYFSIETVTPATKCYLVKGQLNDTAVLMNIDYLIPIAKPIASDGSHIYNAGFEAMMKKDDHLFMFFEFNYFPSKNFVHEVSSKYERKDMKPQTLPINKLPFRITDITQVGKNHYTAINYYYNGEGKDTVYRTPIKDSVTCKLIKDESGYRSYARLIDIEFKHNKFVWKPLWEFPENYMSYNWEGIAMYKNGYFIINDKYTPKKPYQTTLLYLKRE